MINAKRSTAQALAHIKPQANTDSATSRCYIKKAVYRIKKARIVGIMVTTSSKSPPSVHAQREYRCPEGNIVFANGKNIVQGAGLNIVILLQP